MYFLWESMWYTRRKILITGRKHTSIDDGVSENKMLKTDDNGPTFNHKKSYFFAKLLCLRTEFFVVVLFKNLLQVSNVTLGYLRKPTLVSFNS